MIQCGGIYRGIQNSVTLITLLTAVTLIKYFVLLSTLNDGSTNHPTLSFRPPLGSSGHGASGSAALRNGPLMMQATRQKLCWKPASRIHLVAWKIVGHLGSTIHDLHRNNSRTKHFALFGCRDLHESCPPERFLSNTDSVV